MPACASRSEAADVTRRPAQHLAGKHRHALEQLPHKPDELLGRRSVHDAGSGISRKKQQDESQGREHRDHRDPRDRPALTRTRALLVVCERIAIGLLWPSIMLRLRGPHNILLHSTYESCRASPAAAQERGGQGCRACSPALQLGLPSPSAPTMRAPASRHSTSPPPQPATVSAPTPPGNRHLRIYRQGDHTSLLCRRLNRREGYSACTQQHAWSRGVVVHFH